MYVPRHFALEDLDQIADLVAAVGSAEVVTVAEDGSPQASLLPVLWDRTPTQNGAHGRLIAHAAIMNEQFVQVSNGARALAIVRGAQAYISPSWYASKAEHGRVVPTWNYSAVHLSGAGVVTAIPLLMFSGAAIRIPLSTMGLLQYLTPSIQFFLGLFVLNEHMSPVLLTGFLIVWAALALFTFDSLRHGQRNRMLRNATLADDVEAPI